MSPLGSEEIAGLGFEQVIRNAPVAIVVVDASGRVIHSNGRARELTTRQLGREMPADLDGAIDIFHPDGRRYERHEWPAVRSIASGEEIVEEEFFYALPEGARLWIRCSSSPVRERDGGIVAAVLAQTDVTEQKDQEERLTYLAGLLDNTEDAVVAMDASYVLTVWNRGAERLYGWTADEAVGRHANEVARTNLSDEERTELRRDLAATGRWRGEVTVARKDGTTVEVELISVALRGQRAEITGYLSIHRDISERKRAEEALRASQRRSETILESMGDRFSTVDREWRYTYLNERALAKARSVKGRDMTAGDVLGMSCWDFLPELVGTTIDRELHRAMREEQPVEFEAYSQASRNWLEVRAYPSEEGLSVYVHDISARKSAEAEMARRAEQQALVAKLGERALASDDLQAVMDAAVALVARTLDVELAGVAAMPADSDEVFLRAGVGWREGVVGSRIERGGRDSQVGYTLLRRAPVIAEDQSADPRFEQSALAKAHGVVGALTVIITSPEEPFGVLGALSTGRRTFSPSDVSFLEGVANVLASAVERNRAQERLSEVREGERSRIARDLHDDALQELTDALLRADRGRAEGLGPEAAGELVSTLKRVGQELRGAIYDLRLSGEMSGPFPESLGALVDVHRGMAAACEIALDVSWDPSARAPGNDGTEVLRIVGEALTNARRHSGARHVTVSARGSEESLSVQVTDDGRGFDAAAASSATGGVGIKGMRERAALLGGRLEVASAPGAGTTIRFEFGPANHAEPPTTTARILLVEDHAAVRQAIAGMLQQEADLDVVGQAGSLAEARGMLRDVDVAVVDLGLPDGYGGDLITELRDLNAHARALVLSASLDPADTARAISSGADVTLDKTAGLDQLVETVRRLHRGAVAHSQRRPPGLSASTPPPLPRRR